ncbi:Group II intron-encoded protein LtrA [Paenibacillus konkukensis]|uniref:Group II intron-encoded protein LtrA n=1 Tax=Paenibacillus konkukensis TaxID=2020716 RepID=A0ABY4RXB6_9BACL|nr:reverse transcriptase/maturase family protein [Paenibacillus konkukensis]UQZ85352.1 Group II intron-encoded protein LtrA [Paenibacillus konkukensis]UQZ86420.1 Group II intron-encoded protein LtrA [Paenibacillus konkukensis]
MRNPLEVLKSLSTKACNSKYRFQRLYRNLYNPEFYLMAYQNIYAKPGNMTKGADGQTIDGMGMERISKLIDSMRNHSYQPNPARRVYIRKANGKMRPLGIPSFDDKLVQEVVRMMLESIYERTFSRLSHGFRPNRSCHTALVQIKKEFTGAKWFVEGDIKGFFDNIDHHIMVDTLRRRIDDEYFIALIWKFLKAGYLEDWKFHNTYSGTPQGSIISPILSNIYLDRFDKHMEKYIKSFDRGTFHQRTKEYRFWEYKLSVKRKETTARWNGMFDEEKQLALQEIKALKTSMQSVHCRDPFDPTFRRLKYVRYADDFLVGIIGSKEDAVQVKRDIGNYLRETLKLEMSEEKTLITHTATKARFLGYDICVCRDQQTHYGRRSMSNRVLLYMPQEKWLKKLLAYKALRIKTDRDQKKIWRPKHRRYLVDNDDLEILKKYNSEILGMYNYYRLAHNVSNLQSFKYVMEYSMYRTFCLKYQCSIGKLKRKYCIDGKFAVRYQTTSGEKTLFLYNGGFRRQEMPDTRPSIDNNPDNISVTMARTSMMDRIKACKCEWCGKGGVSIHMHHVRKLKDLKGKRAWEKVMVARKRKTMALCVSCHKKLHAGLLD